MHATRSLQKIPFMHFRMLIPRKRLFKHRKIEDAKESSETYKSWAMRHYGKKRTIQLTDICRIRLVPFKHLDFDEMGRFLDDYIAWKDFSTHKFRKTYKTRYGKNRGMFDKIVGFRLTGGFPFSFFLFSPTLSE